MGDPKQQRKKYATPRHPWRKERIEEEKKLTTEYGLKNKREIYKAISQLKRFTGAAKRIVKLGEDKQAQKEAHEIEEKLKRYDLLKEEQKIESILGLATTNFLDRRLQTIVARKGLAMSIGQARQMITHGHIAVNGKKINAPGYMMKKDDEVTYTEKSSFADETHPERMKKAEIARKEVEKTKPQEEKKVEEVAA